MSKGARLIDLPLGTEFELSKVPSVTYKKGNFQNGLGGYLCKVMSGAQKGMTNILEGFLEVDVVRESDIHEQKR